MATEEGLIDVGSEPELYAFLCGQERAADESNESQVFCLPWCTSAKIFINPKHRDQPIVVSCEKKGEFLDPLKVLRFMVPFCTKKLKKEKHS